MKTKVAGRKSVPSPQGKLDVYRFGAALLEAKDLDPVYPLVYHAGFNQDDMRRFLTAYWCFYHVGTASWICDAPVKPYDEQYWKRMMIAARSKEYPRSSERRHFRAANALNSVEYLRALTLSNMFSLFDDARRNGQYVSATKVMAWAQDWTGFGPWIAFKVADMLDRVGYCPVKFTADEALYDSPREGADLMWAAEKGKQPDPDDIGKWALDKLVQSFSPHKAPPMMDRAFGYPEAETVLCKFKSYLGGHYHVGEDVAGCRKALERFPNSPTGEKLFKAGEVAELW